MYEDYRKDIISELVKHYDANAISDIIGCIDRVSVNYSIERTSKELVTGNQNAEIVKQYFACRLVEGMSKNTAEVKSAIINKFCREVCKPLIEVDSNDIRSWLYTCMKTVSNRTADNYRTHISALYDWMLAEKLVSTNPCDKIKPIKYTKTQRRALSDTELEQLRMACETDKERAIIEFLYSTGCRINEAVNVEILDVDFINNSFTVLGKGNKPRTCYISDKCKIYLRKYLNSRGCKSEYLFCRTHAPYGKMTTDGLRFVFNEVVKRSGLEDVTPHTMRHTTATMLLKRDMPITEISKLLGHSKIETTMIYAEVDDREIKHHHEKYIA